MTGENKLGSSDGYCMFCAVVEFPRLSLLVFSCFFLSLVGTNMMIVPARASMFKNWIEEFRLV